ncbi:MAG: Gfo/Idh/MocA family oxidoreductase [Candidatus Hydrogenedentes bacterium]|nr:Gfo/Idh/MocA family oxidoreductase [Candidatus Hydrogenedentota bacterium]
MMGTKRRISRRGFLAVSAAAAAGCATTKEPARPRGAALRVGVIGCGARGKELITALTSDPAYASVGVAAVCDVYEPRRNRAHEMTGAAVERDWRRLIARHNIHAVIIATPDHWHAPMAIAAMEAGKDVYCESPMGLTLEQAAAVRACAARTERVVQIGADEASDAQWRVAAEIVRSGELGAVRWAQAAVVPGAVEAFDAAIEAAATPQTLDWEAFLGEVAGRPFEPARFFQWRAYWDYSGGIATNLYYGKIVPLLLALGDSYPDRVSAAGGVYAEDGRETPDSFVMNVEYPAGHSIVLAHTAAGGRGRPAVIRGERASLEIENGMVRVVPEPGTAGAAERTVATEPGPSHLANWFECIKLRQRCLCNEETGYQAMVAVAMAVEAYKQAKTLRYDVTANTISEAPTRVSVA